MAQRDEHFPWVLSSLGAALVVAAGVALLRFPAPPDPSHFSAEASRPKPMQISRIGQGAANSRLQEELALQDPISLFMPTLWSSGQATDPAWRETGSAFDAFPPQLVFSNEAPAISIPLPVTVPTNALAAVDVLEKQPKMKELSRRELEVPSLAARVAHLQVTAATSGAVVVSQSVLEPETALPAGSSRDFWAPVQALVAVNASGLVGRPIIVAGSGSEQVDNWAMDFLVRRAHLGARLEPGFYRVLLGP